MQLLVAHSQPACMHAVLGLTGLGQIIRSNQRASCLAPPRSPIPSGDEYGQTRQGNNNYYGHDTALTHYDWEALEEAKENGWFRCAWLQALWSSCLNREGLCSLEEAKGQWLVQVSNDCVQPPRCPFKIHHLLSHASLCVLACLQVLQRADQVPAAAPAAGPRRVPHKPGGAGEAPGLPGHAWALCCCLTGRRSVEPVAPSVAQLPHSHALGAQTTPLISRLR